MPRPITLFAKLSQCSVAQFNIHILYEFALKEKEQLLNNSQRELVTRGRARNVVIKVVFAFVVYAPNGFTMLL